MLLMGIIVAIVHALGGTMGYNMMAFIPLFAEVLICSAMVVPSLKKRSFFILRTISWSLAYICQFFLTVYIKDLWPSSLLVRIFLTMFLYGSILGYFFLCFDESWIDTVLSWTTVILIREATDIIYVYLMGMIGVDSRTTITIIQGISGDWSTIVNGALSDIIHAALMFLLTFFFAKNDHQERDTQHIILVMTMSLVVSLVTIVIKNSLVYLYTPESRAMYMASIGTILVLTFILLFFRNAILKSNSDRNERRTIHLMLKNEKAQYETLSENMKTINMMTHDLKHQIENFQDRITEEEVKSLKDAVEGYDSLLKTGNDVIDTVVYEKEMYCRTKGITLTCNANGQAASFMQNYHLYALLNNALGNAIEAVEQLDDSSKKEIGLSIYPDDEYLNIECYNYFDPTKSNTEHTTKQNKNSHGYGIKSINYIAERYKGNVSIRKTGDMFFLEVRVKLNVAPSTFNV